VARPARAAIAAEAALAAREDARGVAEEGAALRVDALGLDHNQRALHLVVDRLDHGVVVIVPLVGISACSSMRCSPCSTMAGFTSMAPPRLSMAGKDGMTANVGSTCRSRS